MWFAPESYNTCGDILTLYNLNMDKFYAWNPTVGSACTGLIAGTCYCVSTGPGGVPPPEPDTDDNDDTPTATATTTTASMATTTMDGLSTPTPFQAGMVSNCDQVHEVESGDTCFDISKKNGVSLDTFYA